MSSQEINQAIIVRNDLKMGKGKIAVQVAHASLSSAEIVKKHDHNIFKRWTLNGQAKIALKVQSLEELLEIYNLTKTSNINELDHFLEKIKYHAGLENDFKKLKIDIKKQYSKIINGVNIQRLSNNPVKIKKEDIKFILLNK